MNEIPLLHSGKVRLVAAALTPLVKETTGGFAGADGQPDEQIRPRDPGRHRTATRAVLRMALSAFAGEQAANADFEISPGGKPSIAGGGPRFSLAHTGGLMCVALHRTREVGVDIERTNRRVKAMQVARAYFADCEIEALRTAVDGNGLFLRMWTAKEAVLKCEGTGLAGHLAEAVVHPAGAGRAAVHFKGMVWNVEWVLVPADSGEALVAVTMDPRQTA